MARKHSLVLDTHVWLWFVSGNAALHKDAVSEITKAAFAGSVFIPAISVWEISMLQARGRITLSKPLENWVEEALNLSGFLLYPLTPAVSVESCRLPGELHADPADRMIIATARIENATVMTRDKRILEYARSGFVSTRAV